MKGQTYNSIEERWENYRIANNLFPNVRRAEVLRQLELTSPQKGEIVLEIGTGNGYLTFELAKAVGKNGRVITYDYQKSNIEFVERNKGGLSIRTVNQTEDYNFIEPNGSIDKISTIATLHHYDDRSRSTGISGRQKAINEFYRMLRNEGTLTIGDVAINTSSQRYFDAIDNPIYCYPNGHPHDFLDERLARELCQNAGFKNIEFRVESVPWTFESEEQAKYFLHTIHNAKCSPEESFELAKRYLNLHYANGKLSFDWKLFYLTAKK